MLGIADGAGDGAGGVGLRDDLVAFVDLVAGDLALGVVEKVGTQARYGIRFAPGVLGAEVARYAALRDAAVIVVVDVGVAAVVGIRP